MSSGKQTQIVLSCFPKETLVTSSCYRPHFIHIQKVGGVNLCYFANAGVGNNGRSGIPRLNGSGVIPFPGNDQACDVILRQFLAAPIDSRLPCEAPKQTEKSFQFVVRASEPSPEVKKEWDDRMGRIQKRDTRTKLLAARELFTRIPSVVARQKVPDIKNPYHCLPVEEIADARDTKIHGPLFQAPKLPNLRSVPVEMVPSKRLVRSSLR